MNARAYKRSQWWICRRKHAYVDLNTAHDHQTKLRIKGSEVFVYRCPFSSHYHLGRLA